MFSKKSFLFSFYQGCGCHHAHQLTEHNFQLKISFCSTCSLTHKLGRAAGEEEIFCGKSHVQFNTILLLFDPLRPIFWSSTVKEGWSTWTPGTERRSASSSAGATWNPFTLINSFRRSVMNQSPSSSYLVKQTIVKTFLHFLTFQHLQCGSSPQSRWWQQWLQGCPSSRSSRLDLV